MSYTPHTATDIREMLAVIGAADVEELLADIPAGVRLQRRLAVPEALSEPELVRRLRAMAARSRG